VHGNRLSIPFLCLVVALAGLASLDAQRQGGAPGGGRAGAPGGGRAGGPGGRGGPAGGRTGRVERITVASKALEGNAAGNAAERAVTVYLPPSYSDETRRFPVLYLLAGGDGHEDTFIDRLAALPESANRLSAAQGFSDLIVVTPNAAAPAGTTLYASAPAAGDWERFIADELVAEIDKRYRTLTARLSRGLAGHDAGAYAAWRLGMKRPDVFSSLYAMSACCLANDPTVPPALTLLDTNAANLQRYYAVAMDVGRQDPLLADHRQMHQALSRLRVPHVFEDYDGDHTNGVRDRIALHVLPFFSKNLVAPANPTSPQIKD
jgi:enterochelin esterase-like enzyme